MKQENCGLIKVPNSRDNFALFHNEDLYYSDYELFSNWISNLEDSELETKVILISELDPLDSGILPQYRNLLRLIDNNK